MPLDVGWKLIADYRLMMTEAEWNGSAGQRLGSRLASRPQLIASRFASRWNWRPTPADNFQCETGTLLRKWLATFDMGWLSD